jgi:glycosyltransferase involved in cell wall biosynthesis
LRPLFIRIVWMKKRILLVNEASYLSTGFSVYGWEMLRRLVDSNKFEIAEFGAYGQDDDPRWRSLPWKFYPNQPAEGEEVEKYNNRITNQFGEWRFERTCLDFKPHIVWDIRDWWMMEFVERSPFRPFFKWIIMPTVDSAPQDDQWIASYIGADKVYTYSPFGYNTLAKQGGGLIKLGGCASPGANLEDFPYIADKRAHKKNLNMPQDVLVIGTVMRNQERKLYPDLMESFKIYLEKAPPELAAKTFLYLHTSYPDVGWQIPKFLKHYGIVNKTLFTYSCRDCGSVFPSFYRDARTFCKSCHHYSCTLPGVHAGIERKALGSILNLFDAYVQYAVCEGFGMPLVEAAACGIPTLAVDYSAMADIIRDVGGISIHVQRMFCDPKTHAYRALPDNIDLANKLLDLFQKSPEDRAKIGAYGRKAVEDKYSWDSTAKKWEECFDELDVLPDAQSWKSSSRISQPNINYPPGLNNDEFIQWAIRNIAGRPELINTYVYLRLVRDLNWEATQSGPTGMYFNESSFGSLQAKWVPFNRNNVVQEMTQACEQKNAWEQQRLGGM